MRIPSITGLFTLGALSATVTSGQTQLCTTTGGPQYDRPQVMVSAPDGGYAIGGFYWLGDLSFVDMEILKLDASGNLQWGKVLHGGGVDYGMCVAGTSDDGFVLGGYTKSFTNNDWDAVVVKFSAAGAIEWTTTIGTSEQDMALAIHALPSGDIALAGKVYDGSSLNDGLVALLQADGDLVWAKRVHDPANRTIELHGVAEAPDGGILVSGGRWDVTNSGVVIRLEADGEVHWAKTFPAALGYGAASFGDEGFAVAGMAYSPSSTDMCIMRLDTAGTALWSASLPAAGQQRGSRVSRRPNGGVVLAGEQNLGTADVRWMVAAFDESGDLEWNRIVGNQATTTAGIHAKADNGFALGGTWYTSAGLALLDQDGMPCEVCGVDSLSITPASLSLVDYNVTMLPGGTAGTGTWTVTDVTGGASTVCSTAGIQAPVDEYAVTVSPNPVQSILEVRLPVDWASARFELIDATGRAVLEMPFGSNALRVDVSGLNQGPYLYRLIEEGMRFASGRLMVAR